MKGFVGAALLFAVAVSAVPAIPAILSAGTQSNSLSQGSAVVQASSKQNFFDFQFTGVLNNGDQIGFYIFDSTATVAGTGATNEYDCGAVAANLKPPLLSVSPSFQFNGSAASNLTITTSPSRTEFFGGLPGGRYKMCYCKKPDATEKNPSRTCRPADYKWSVGVFHFYDVPELRQRKSVYVNKTFNRFNFQVQPFTSFDGSKLRVVIPDADQSYQKGYSNTKGCSTKSFLGSTPQWSNGATSETTQKTPLKSILTTATYSEVAFHLPYVQSVPSATPAGFYSVCLCDATNIGDLSGTCQTGCDTIGCSTPSIAPVEIATFWSTI